MFCFLKETVFWELQRACNRVLCEQPTIAGQKTLVKKARKKALIDENGNVVDTTIFSANNTDNNYS